MGWGHSWTWDSPASGLRTLGSQRGAGYPQCSIPQGSPRAALRAQRRASTGTRGQGTDACECVSTGAVFILSVPKQLQGSTAVTAPQGQAPGERVGGGQRLFSFLSRILSQMTQVPKRAGQGGGGGCVSRQEAARCAPAAPGLLPHGNMVRVQPHGNALCAAPEWFALKCVHTPELASPGSLSHTVPLCLWCPLCCPAKLLAGLGTSPHMSGGEAGNAHGKSTLGCKLWQSAQAATSPARAGVWLHPRVQPWAWG